MSDFTLKANGSAARAPYAIDNRVPRSLDAGHVHAPAEQRLDTATKEQVQAAVKQIESYLASSRRELQFQVDERSGEIVVRVRDATSGEVIRQIPSEEVLRVARALQENENVTPVLLDLIV